MVLAIHHLRVAGQTDRHMGGRGSAARREGHDKSTFGNSCVVFLISTQSLECMPVVYLLQSMSSCGSDVVLFGFTRRTKVWGHCMHACMHGDAFPVPICWACSSLPDHHNWNSGSLMRWTSRADGAWVSSTGLSSLVPSHLLSWKASVSSAFYIFLQKLCKCRAINHPPGGVDEVVSITVAGSTYLKHPLGLGFWPVSQIPSSGGQCSGVTMYLGT